MLSASLLPRLHRCRAVATLPQYPTENEDARRGTALHLYCSSGVITEGYEEECANIQLDTLPKGDCELAMAWDSVSGECRELGQGLNRKYDVRPTEVPGTFDIVGPTWVADLKMGFKPVDPAAANWQLLLGALCLSRIHDLREVEVKILKLQEDGSFWVDSAIVDTFALASFEAELKKSMAGGPPVPGDWCQHCPSYSACPAKISLIRELALNPPAVVHIDSENAALVYARLQLIKQAAGAVEASLKAFAAEGTIPLGDGRYYGQVETIKEDIDAEKASGLLGVVPGAFRFTTSKTAITKAYGKEALERLRAAGAVVRRSVKTVREFKR